MTRLFDRFFGRSRSLARARNAERLGDLANAIALFERGKRPDEALRVRKARALRAVAGPAVPPATVFGREAVAVLAAELESLGEFTSAAEAYALAHDVEGQARALARAGEVDRLDDLLVATQGLVRDGLARRREHDEFEMLVASGKRRDAVALARTSADEGLRVRGDGVYARRLKETVVRVVVRGHARTLVLGESIVVGRGHGLDERGANGARDEAIGTISVTSAAVSRRHLSIVRRDGQVWVRDLASHNGTRMRGAPLAGEVCVGDGIELRLGDEVPLIVQPAGEWPDAFAVEVSGRRYLAPLGPAKLGIGEWRLELVRAAGFGDWVELVTDEALPAFANDLRLSGRVTLLAGDAIAAERGARAAFVVRAPQG